MCSAFTMFISSCEDKSSHLHCGFLFYRSFIKCYYLRGGCIIQPCLIIYSLGLLLGFSVVFVSPVSKCIFKIFFRWTHDLYLVLNNSFIASLNLRCLLYVIQTAPRLPHFPQPEAIEGVCGCIKQNYLYYPSMVWKWAFYTPIWSIIC